MNYHYTTDKFDGFLTSVFRKYGEINYKKIFTIESTEKHATSYSDPIQLFNPNPTKTVSWHTKNVTNATLQINLKNTRFLLNSVSIRSRNDDIQHFPTEISIEGSNDGSNWFLLHHYKSSTLTGKGKEETLYTKEETKRPYSKFRLIQIKTDQKNWYYFVLNRLDFFGYTQYRSCMNNHKSRSLRFIEMFSIILIKS